MAANNALFSLLKAATSDVFRLDGSNFVNVAFTGAASGITHPTRAAAVAAAAPSVVVRHELGIYQCSATSPGAKGITFEFRVAVTEPLDKDPGDIGFDVSPAPEDFDAAIEPEVDAQPDPTDEDAVL